jgi:sortase B
VTDFHNEAHFNDFIYTIKNRSNYNYGVNVTTNDQIITLSTCVGFTDRAVLHAKLIKLIAK